jgi:diadenosine tetraphosphate (Ap4A) HIT family hydrolase
MSQCPFCDIDDDRAVASNELAVALKDRYPASPGHLLFVTRRHVSSWFDATRDERIAIMDLVDEVFAGGGIRADGYNLGINIGAAAGQTVMHLHVHLIPRHEGDSEDPRGGIRWVLPRNARYWR